MDNPDIERTIIGEIMLDDDNRQAMIDALSEDDFYSPVYHTIFAELKNIVMENGDVDLFTVTNALRKSGKLDTIGGVGTLASISSDVMSSANYESHVEILKELTLRRDAIRVCMTAMQACEDETSDPVKIVSQASSALFDLNVNKTSADLTLASDKVNEVFLNIEKRIKGDNSAKGLPTGFKQLDRYLGGLKKPDFIVLAAPSGQGKTALAVNIALNVALKGTPVLYFILEMSDTQLIERMIQCHAEVDLRDAEFNRKLGADDKTRVMNSLAKIKVETKFFIKSKGNLSLEEINSIAHRAKREHGIGLVVIDYLQQITGKQNKSGNREQEVASISRGLKSLAMNLNVPVLSLIQINGDETPRESRAIIHDADIFMVLRNRHTEENIYDYGAEPLEDNLNIREVYIQKHRNGASDIHILLQWKPTVTRFHSSDMEYEPHKSKREKR